MSDILDENVKQQVRQAFAGLQHPVQVLFFGTQEECEYCGETRQLLEEVVTLSPQLGLSVYDLQANAEVARQYRVDKTPAFVLTAKERDALADTGIQYAGIPAGHEFTTLVQDIVLVAGRDSGLKPATREFLKGLQKPVHLQVFVTPTCLYCPRAVILAHQMAMENPAMIRAEGVESMEFQELAEQFNVIGVPQTSINTETMIGVVPESNLLAELKMQRLRRRVRKDGPLCRSRSGSGLSVLPWEKHKEEALRLCLAGKLIQRIRAVTFGIV